MDNPLIFGYFGKIVMSEEKTEMEWVWVEMIRPPRSEEVKSRKSLFAIIRASSASWRKLTRDFVSTSKKLSRYQILSKPYHKPTQVDWY